MQQATRPMQPQMQMQMQMQMQPQMQEVRLYSDADEAAVVAAMPKLMQEAEMLRSRHVAPTTTARRAIIDVILSFVRTNGRKVYGGYALNAAVSAVSPTNAFYSCDPDADPPDIEFYSPDPVADVCELCRTLHAAGHEYVQGKEAMHHGTFTISVEFVRMCDITYVPACTYDHLPTTTDAAEGVDVIAPSFAMIDLLRVVCDPFTSHWRLDRMFSRLCLLQRLFPLQRVEHPQHGNVDTSPAAAMVARAMIASKPSCLAVGFAAFCAYFPEHEEAAKLRSNVVSAVSTKWHEDTYVLEIGLVSLLGREQVVVHNFSPFMDLFGRRRVFTVKGADGGDAEVVAVLYDAGHRAVPTCGLCDGTDGLVVAAFPYVLAMALSCAFHARTEGADDVAQRFQQMAASMCAARAERLTAEGGTVVDRCSALRDFGGMDHVGDTWSTMRSHMAHVDERMGGGGGRRGREQAWFTFDPSKNKADPVRTFSDVSGRFVRQAAATGDDATNDSHQKRNRTKRTGGNRRTHGAEHASMPNHG